MTDPFSDASIESTEPLLVQARTLLDAKGVGSAGRAAFLSSLEEVIAGDDPGATLDIPPPVTAVGKDVVSLVGRHISATPPQEPITAEEQLRELLLRNRTAPPVPFAERVNTSPVRVGATKAAADAPVRAVEMTESDYELLQDKIKRRRESQSKSTVLTIPADGDLPSDEVRDEGSLDASAVAAAVSSDFKIDLVESVSEST
jgi:hypothetical protein